MLLRWLLQHGVWAVVHCRPPLIPILRRWFLLGYNEALGSVIGGAREF
jgi:hypothetical protein